MTMQRQNQYPLPTFFLIIVWFFLIYNLKSLYQTRQEIKKFIQKDSHFIIYPPPIQPLVLAN